MHTSNSLSLKSTPSQPRREPAASVDRREQRNWIVILFSKAICKCYQKFSSHACYSPFAGRLPQTRSNPRPPVGFPCFFEPRMRRTHATRWATSEFRIFRRTSQDDRVMKESVMVSSFSKFRRQRNFSRAFIGP